MIFSPEKAAPYGAAGFISRQTEASVYRDHELLPVFQAHSGDVGTLSTA